MISMTEVTIKKKGLHVDKPTSEEVDKMYQVASDTPLSLTESPRVKTLSWHT